MINLLNVLKNNNIESILDVGANLGDWATFVKLNFPHIKLFCIEANQDCEQFLKNKNLNYLICCLSDCEKSVKFYKDPNSCISTGSSYYLENTNFFNNTNYVELQAKPLDAIISDVFDYIKLDTQGSEIDIIKGGINTISKSKFVQIETSLIEYNINSPLKGEVFAYMQSIGFDPLIKVEEHYMNGQLIQEDFIFRNKKL